MNFSQVLARIAQERRRFRRRFRKRPLTLLRQLVAIFLFITATFLAFKLPAAEGKVGTTTVVTSRDLASGSTLTAQDVCTILMPDSLRPTGSFSTVSAVIGKLVTSNVRKGETLTDNRLLTPITGMPDSEDPTTAAVPIRLADSGIADLLHSGNHVDVVALKPDQQEPHVLASNAIVLTVIMRETTRQGSDAHANGPLVLVKTSTEVAAKIAAATLEHPVTVILR